MYWIVFMEKMLECWNNWFKKCVSSQSKCLYLCMHGHWNLFTNVVVWSCINYDKTAYESMAKKISKSSTKLNWCLPNVTSSHIYINGYGSAPVWKSCKICGGFFPIALKVFLNNFLGVLFNIFFTSRAFIWYIKMLVFN